MVMYQVSHRTTFTYTNPVAISHHILRLLPRVHPRQHALHSTVLVEPSPSVRTEGMDYYGNPMMYLTIQEPHAQLVVSASSRIEVRSIEAILLDRSPPWEQVVHDLQSLHDPDTHDALQFLYNSPYVISNDAAYDYAQQCFPYGRPLLAAVMELTTRIFQEFRYEGGVTDVSTPVDEVLETKRGVCQDFAHVEIALLRSLGLSARYISGYLLTHPPEGKEKLAGADASHAWISVWCPGYGWIDFDPTNNMIPGDEHITLAWGRDYGDVSPINGFMVGGGEHTVAVAVDVVPVE
ncbi:MAG: transglutaminase [Nitrospirales bacterium]|nr:MAG: transglutaminase [Nitrospirales bacterium]